MKQKKRMLALAMAGLCLLSACGGGEDGEPERRWIDDVKVSDAYFGLAYYKNGTLNPVTDNTNINRLVCEALYEGLFEVSANFTAEGVLCSEYEGDGTTFTFTLRDGVTFWSGADLIAADVVASLNAARLNEASPYYNRMAEVAAVEEVNNRQVRITLSSPNINLPRLLDIPVYRRGSESGGDFADGTGPFRPVQEGSQWLLRANEDWHGGFLGSIRTITLLSLSRADAAESSFQTGDVSMIREARIAPESSSFGGSIDTVGTPGAELHYLGVNYGSDTLSDARVRRALSAAIGRKSLCEVQLQTFADPAVLPVNPQPSNEALGLDMSADTERAVRLLQEAGLQTDTPGTVDTHTVRPQSRQEDGDEEGGEDGDGYEDGDHGGDDTWEDDTWEDDPDEGTEGGSGGGLSLRLLVNSDNAFKTAAADQIAASWSAVGISVTVDKQPFEDFMYKLEAGDFDLYYGETRLTPDFDLRPLLSASGSLNYGHYSSQATADAIAAARRGEDITALYERLLNEMPLIPIAFERGQLIVRKGLIDNFSPAPYNAFAGLENWTSSD